MPVVQVNGGELTYQERGRGETPIVFSMMSFGASFEELSRLLAADYHVYAVNLRALAPGQKQDPRDPYLPQWAKDVHDFARAMRLGKFFYAGISHGGLVGWYLALTYPDALAGFVSIVGVPQDRSFLQTRAVRELIQPPTTSEQRRAMLASHFAPTDDPVRLKRREALLAQLEQERAMPRREGLPVGPGLAFPDCRTNEELRARLGGIRVPTLILHGMYDHFSGPEMAVLAAGAVPGAKTVFFQDESHFLSMESPHKVADEIRLFIKCQTLNRSPQM